MNVTCRSGPAAEEQLHGSMLPCAPQCCVVRIRLRVIGGCCCCAWAQDYHTIYKLCYSDLQDAAQRAALAHIAAEGRSAYEAFAAHQPQGPPGISLKARRHPSPPLASRALLPPATAALQLSRGFLLFACCACVGNVASFRNLLHLGRGALCLAC